MSGAWRGLSVSFPLSLHLQINSLLTEKINNQKCHNETVSAKLFNWSMESKCNYLRNNCMKKKKTSVERGLWEQWGLRMLFGYRIEWWKLKKWAWEILTQQFWSYKKHFYCSQWCKPKKKKKKKNWKDKIALCTIWNSLMDRWMDGFLLLLV